MNLIIVDDGYGEKFVALDLKISEQEADDMRALMRDARIQMREPTERLTDTNEGRRYALAEKIMEELRVKLKENKQ